MAIKWPFIRPGKQVQQDAPPPGVLDFVDYQAEPGAANTDAAYWFPEDSPDLSDSYFPTIAQQDQLLVHWDRPPADTNPQAWYDDRNTWAKVQRDKVEHQEGVPQPALMPDAPQPGDDPRWSPPSVDRMTAHLNPMGYSFTRPYDQDMERELDGVHLSLAMNRRAYTLTGSAGLASPWNNSYRIEPPTNDDTAVFVGDTVEPMGVTVLSGTQQSVHFNNNQAYRLM